MSHKICYLSSEITPFASAYSLGKFSRKITSLYHEDPDLDIRLMMPKYGFISERKYILREVIRLKNIPTVPSKLSEEKKLNPFLKFDDRDYIDSIGMDFVSDTVNFKNIRKLKDDF